MKVVIDTLGGDYAPYEIIKGAVDAQNKYKDLSLVLCGKPEEIEKVLSGLNMTKKEQKLLMRQRLYLATKCQQLQSEQRKTVLWLLPLIC